jgi:preprotein translocase subunit SecG
MSAEERFLRSTHLPRRSLPVLTDALVVVDVVAALGLIVLILLHSGRGGGLSDMFGASAGSSAAGSTVAERNLDRITITFVLVFVFVTISLALRWS